MPVRLMPLLLRAGILLAFLVSAHAQAPRSPVLSAVAASAETPVRSLSDLIKALDADGKTRALDGLDRLDRAVLDAAVLAELSEAYRLLGRPEEALKAARTLSARDANNPTGDAQSILALAQAGNYAAAQAAAESGLKRFPGDKNLLALFHQVKGRGPAVTKAAETRASVTRASVTGATGVDRVEANRSIVFSTKEEKTKTSVPVPLMDGDALGYVPGPRKQKTMLEQAFDRATGAVENLFAFADRRQSPKDIADMNRLKKVLDRTETGRAIVAELGGWAEIDKTVDVRMAWLPSGVVGKAIPLNGYRHKLYLSREMGGATEAVAASAFVHELSHIADFKRGEGGGGLAMPSEYAAHRIQVRTFLEIRSRMSKADKQKAAGQYLWEYSNFIADLWEDHILARFPQKDAFALKYGNVEVEGMADLAYQDLAMGQVSPGSPHLDHHLNDPKQGMYAVLTGEKDIVDIVQQKIAEGKQVTPFETGSLKTRAAMMSRMDAKDAAYRRTHGLGLDLKK